MLQQIDFSDALLIAGVLWLGLKGIQGENDHSVVDGYGSEDNVVISKSYDPHNTGSDVRSHPLKK